MIINNQNQTVVVGFLCEYKDASSIPDNSWVSITGTITKGEYFGSIPIIKIEELATVEKPNDDLVYPPDDVFIPTCTIY